MKHPDSYPTRKQSPKAKKAKDESESFFADPA